MNTQEIAFLPLIALTLAVIAAIIFRKQLGALLGQLRAIITPRDRTVRQVFEVKNGSDKKASPSISDIFISYKREEQPIARKLADALEGQGWSVWWDPKLRAGEHFDDVIEKALNEAKCVVVMWSERSVQSRYVRDEATYALDRDKLVPVTIEKVNLPFRFRGVHALSLLGWDGSRDSSEFRRLVEDIAARLGPSMTEAKRKPDEVKDRNSAQQIAQKLSQILRDPYSSGPHTNELSEDDIAEIFRESISDVLADRKREREGEKFSVVQADSIREYSRQDVDKLTTTQRERLFEADSEMPKWWRGKSPANKAWPLFRLKDGIWVAKDQFDQLTEEQYVAIGNVVPSLIEWYLQDRKF